MLIKIKLVRNYNLHSTPFVKNVLASLYNSVKSDPNTIEDYRSSYPLSFSLYRLNKADSTYFWVGPGYKVLYKTFKIYSHFFSTQIFLYSSPDTQINWRHLRA